MSPELLKIGEASKRADVSVDAIRKLCDNGSLKFVRTKGNHRLFNVNDIITLQKPKSNFDYVEKAKKLRAIRKDKTALLDQELLKFEGNVTGVKLGLYEKIYKSNNGDVSAWSLVKNESKSGEMVSNLFIARHLEGNVFEYKCFPLYPDTRHIPGPLESVISNFGGRDVEVSKVSDTTTGSLSDVLEELTSQISRI